MLDPFLHGADIARDLRKLVVPGLPAAPSAKKPMLGSTTTNLFAPQNETVASGAPSIKLIRQSDGGVVVEIRRKSRFGALIDDGDLSGLKRIAGQMVSRAEAQSQGPLLSRVLAQRGHPYGRGAGGRMRGKLGRIGQVRGVRGSVPSLSVVNRQSGNFARSWESDVSHDDKGVVIRLSNASKVAGFLAFGTRKSVAHGPFVSAPLLFMPQVDAEWQKIIRSATRRKSMEQDVATTLGII